MLLRCWRSLWCLIVVAAITAACVGCSSSNSDTTSVDDGGAGPVKWCDAYKILNCSCQQCHQDPPLHGAPIPLMTYADTQAPFPSPTADRKVWQEMQTVISTGFMPFTGDSAVMPPVQPLTDDQQTTLLSWLAQGAHDEGGQDCPNTCDWSK
jgi:hypothetical protein